MVKLFQSDQWLKDVPFKSDDEGNLLQLRNNGMYYGIEAPPDLRSQYIDSVVGDDNNPGTYDRPLKTVLEAYKRLVNVQSQSGVIFLKQGQTFNIYKSGTNTRDYSGGENLNITFDVWADDYWTWWRANRWPDGRSQPYYDIRLHRDFPRPTLYFSKHLDDTYCFMDRLKCKSVSCYGIRIEINEDCPTTDKPGNFPGLWGDADSEKYDFCVIAFSGDKNANRGYTNGYRWDSWSRGSKIALYSCRIDNFDIRKHAPMGYPHLNPAISVRDWQISRDGLYTDDGPRGRFPVIYPGGEQYYQQFTFDFVCNWSAPPDRKLKKVYGATLSWDIFKYN